MNSIIEDIQNGGDIDKIMKKMRTIYKTEGSLSNKISIVRKKILLSLEMLNIDELRTYDNYEHIHKLLSSKNRYEQVKNVKKCQQDKNIPDNIKKIINELDILPKYLINFRISLNEQHVLYDKKKQSLQHKLENIIEIPDIENMIQKSIRFIETANEKTSCIKLCCCLLLLTGRRISEIVYTAEFSTCFETEYGTYFQGQLKKREDEDVCYLIPLLAPLNTIQYGIRLLRNKNTSITTNANKYVEKMFPGVTHIHLLRSIYIRTVFHKFSCQSAFPALAKACLGHEEFTESLHYSSVIVNVVIIFNICIKIVNGKLKFIQ